MDVSYTEEEHEAGVQRNIEVLIDLGMAGAGGGTP